MIRLSRHCPLSQPHWSLQPQALWNIKQQRWLLAIVVGCSGVSTAWADPNLPAGYDPALSSGVSSVVNSGTTQTITTNAQNSLGSFNTFNIGAGYSVNVNQPNAGSNFMGIVRSGSPTQIFGRLNSNGTVGIVNPGGVYVGPGGAINTQGFIGTTHQLDQEKYLLEGQLEFNHIPGNTSSVVNDGSITVGDNGFVLLSGQHVENNGTITAPGGEVNLVSSGKVHLVSQDGVRLTLDQAATLSVANASDSLFSGVVNTSGRIEVSSVVQNADGSVSLLAPGGDVEVSGEVLANTDSPGSVDVFGDTIAISGRLEANGKTGGGAIRVGGAFQGQSLEDSYNATHTTITEAATLQANATVSGNGGEIIVWSDETTSVAGAFEAKGGSVNGNGGLVETSGKVTLSVEGSTTVDTTAANGQTGTWLLDPEDLTIANSGGDITPGTITTALGSNNVVIHTNNDSLSENGDITIADAITYSSSNSLSLLATRHIYANASIQNSGTGDLNLVAGWDEATGFTPAGTAGLESGAFNMSAIFTNTMSYGNNSGSLYVNSVTGTSGVALGSAGGILNVAAQDVILQGGNDAGEYAQLGYDTDSVSVNSNIRVEAKGNLHLLAGNGTRSKAHIGHGRYSWNNDPVTADLTGNVTLNAGDVLLRGGTANDTSAYIGHAGTQLDGDHSGDITVTSQNSIRMLGQNAQYSTLQIGHGGDRTAGNLNGNITLNAVNSIESTAGSQRFSGHTIGHGGAGFTGDLSGDISVTSQTGDLVLQAGSHQENYTLLGHGGWNSRGDRSGSVSLSSGNAVSLSGGTGNEAFVQVGHNLREGSGYSLSGNISLDAQGSINLVSGSGDDSYTFIGHGGAFAGNSSPSGTITGNVTIDSEQNLTLSSGVGLRSFAMIGLGAEDVNATINGEVSVSYGGNGVIQAGTGYESFAMIGIGGDYSTGAFNGDITLSGNNLTLSGATVANNNNVHIGNGTTHNGGRASTQQGNITIDLTGELSVVENNSLVRIGHTSGGDDFTQASNANILIQAASLDFANDTVDSNSFNVNNANFVSAITNNLSGGDVTLASTNADIVWDSALTPATNNNFSLLSTGDITFLDSVQLNGSGEVNVVAGWDGNTGLSGSTFTMGDVLGNTSSYGNSSASIALNAATAGNAVAVGSSGAATSLAGYNLTLSGGTSSDRYAQVGSRQAGTVSGALNGYFKNAVTVQGGSGSRALAQFGHGGDGISGNKSGNITLTGTTLDILGGSNRSAATVGHSALRSSGDYSGDITATFTGDARIHAGGFVSYAVVGHGADNNDSTNTSGNISLTANDVSIQAGNNDFAWATIGHTFVLSNNKTVTGDINVNASDSLQLTSGDNIEGFTRIGHGGARYNDLDANGSITVNANGGLTMISGTGSTSMTQIGHGGELNSLDTTSAITVSSSGAITMTTSNTGNNKFAQIGHGGYNVNGNINGSVSLTAADINLQGGAGFGNYLMLGHGGRLSSGSSTGDISVTANNLSLLAGSNTHTWTLLGHGGNGSSGDRSGAIFVQLNQDLTLQGGSGGNPAFSQVGHGGNDSDGALSGDLTVSANDITLIGGGIATARYTMIGHGSTDWSIASTGSRTGNIAITASGELSLVDNASATLIGHRSGTTSAVSSASLLIRAASLDFANDTIDTSSFTINNASFVTNLQNALAGGNVTLASTNADIIWDSSLAYNSANTFSLLGQGAVTVNQGITNNGSGSVNLVAGWDGASNAINSDASVNVNNLTLATTDTHNLTLNAAVTADAGAGNRSVLAMADGNFAGGVTNSINAGNGYYLLYATNRTGTGLNGLSATNYYGGLANHAISSKASNSHIFDYGAQLTVAALDQTTVYGNNLDSGLNQVSIAGFLDGDTGSALQGGVTLTSSGVDVGSYTLNASSNGLASVESGKYQFAYVNGTHTITPRTITVSVADAVKLQGKGNPAFNLNDFSSQLVNGDTSASILSGVPQFSTGANQDSPVGNYGISVGSSVFAGLKANNYSIQTRPGTLRVLSFSQGLQEGLVTQRDVYPSISATSSLPSELLIPSFFNLPTKEAAFPVAINRADTKIKLLSEGGVKKPIPLDFLPDATGVDIRYAENSIK